MSSDLLTDLQRHLRDLNDNFASVVEQLVHIAPPVPVDSNEDVVPASEVPPSAVSQAELQTKAQELSHGVVQRFKDINNIIDKLPELRERPEQQDVRIGELLREHHELRKELGEVMTEAERKLEEVHGCYEVLSNHALSQAGKMGGGGGF